MTMLDLHFNALFAIMERELPELHSSYATRDCCDWDKKYWEDDLCVFMQCLGSAVTTVAQWEGRYVDPFYRITDLNRFKVRENFEERLCESIADPELEYTERDKELVAEYFRINAPLMKEST